MKTLYVKMENTYHQQVEMAQYVTKLDEDWILCSYVK